MSQINDDVLAYAAGDVSADELAQRWVEQDWVAPRPRPAQPLDVWINAEDQDRPVTGTWEEVERLWLQGVLDYDQYFALDEAVDRHAGVGE